MCHIAKTTKKIRERKLNTVQEANKIKKNHTKFYSRKNITVNNMKTFGEQTCLEIKLRVTWKDKQLRMHLQCLCAYVY